MYSLYREYIALFYDKVSMFVSQKLLNWNVKLKHSLIAVNQVKKIPKIVLFRVICLLYKDDEIQPIVTSSAGPRVCWQHCAVSRPSDE